MAGEAADRRRRAEQARDETLAAVPIQHRRGRSALQLQNIGPARIALDKAPKEYRNWEWRHLHSQLEGARLIMPAPLTHSESRLFVASPVGSEVAVACGSDHRVRVWDTTTGTERVRWSGPEAPRDVYVYSPDGKRLATGSENHAVHVWDVATGTLLAKLVGHQGMYGASLESGWTADRLQQRRPDIPPLGRDNGPVTCPPRLERREPNLPALFSLDGKWIATGSGKEICLWGGMMGQPLGVLGSHEHTITRLAIIRDGQWIASVARDEKVIVLWDPATRKQVASLAVHADYYPSLAISPAGSRLISATYDFLDPSPRLWDASTGQLIKVMAGHTNCVKSVEFSPDGTRVVSASLDRTAYLWDGPAGERIAALRGHSGIVSGASFSPDGQLVVTYSDDQTLRLWHGKTGELLSVLRGHTGSVWGVVFTATGDLVSASDDNTLRVWDMDSARNGVCAGMNFTCTTSPLVVMARSWLPRPGTTRCASGRCAPPSNWDVRWCMSVRLSPRWHLAPTASRSRWLHGTTRSTSGTWPAANGCTCCLVPRATGSAIAGWPSIPPAPCWPGGDGMAGRGSGMWRPASPPEFSRGGNAYLRPRLQPRWPAARRGGSLWAVRLWDLATRQSAGELPGPTGREARVAYSRDGSLIAWVTTDDTVRVAETRTLRELASLYNGTTVYTVAFSPDGTPGGRLQGQYDPLVGPDIVPAGRRAPRPHRLRARRRLQPRRHPARLRLRGFHRAHLGHAAEEERVRLAKSRLAPERRILEFPKKMRNRAETGLVCALEIRDFSPACNALAEGRVFDEL